MRPEKYQRHVDGLRAVAVLGVIFYHYGHPWFRGGYIGVDVFFVISGYLITRLILDEIYETGAFDFRRFYVRRMRRLLPSLFVTLGASLLAAIALLSPEQFQRFGRSLAAAVFSCSNVLFWTESGYFDVDARLKPLLHTWSLGVEEQFYLLWPAFLYLIGRRTDRRSHPYWLGLAAVSSFGLNAAWVAGQFDLDYRSTIFFLTPFRIFELALGALAVHAAPIVRSRRWVHESGMLLGLAAIGYATVAYTDALIFPYYYALVPCVGAFLVILSGESRIAASLLTNRISVGIGLISYSLYLVHWPMLVFYEHGRLTDPTSREWAAGFALTVIAAWVMYRYVETPLRRPAASGGMPQARFVMASVASGLLIGLLGLQIGGSSGWVWRNPRALTATEVAQGKQRRFDLYNAGCSVDRRADHDRCKMDRPYQILFLGDSHEPDGYNSFAAIYGDRSDVNLIGFGSLNSCGIQVGPHGLFTDVVVCKGRAEALNDHAFVSSLTSVVVSANRPFQESGDIYWQIVSHLKRLNPRLSLAAIGGFLIIHGNCSDLYSEHHTFSACKDPGVVAYAAFRERNEHALPAEMRGIDYLYIDRMRLLCRQATLSSCVVEAEGEPAFYDEHHLSFGFARYVGKRIASVYGDELRAAGFPDPRPR
jgi:peptidoglycan/LPS O-acetylase OafA/YrhL